MHCVTYSVIKITDGQWNVILHCSWRSCLNKSVNIVFVLIKTRATRPRLPIIVEFRPSTGDRYEYKNEVVRTPDAIA